MNIALPWRLDKPFKVRLRQEIRSIRQSTKDSKEVHDVLTGSTWCASANVMLPHEQVRGVLSGAEQYRVSDPAQTAWQGTPKILKEEGRKEEGITSVPAA